MHHMNDTAASPKFGFAIRRRKQSMQKDMHAMGIAGLESLIIASIVSGINTENGIQAEAAGILGHHYYDTVSRLLVERCGISWFTNIDGEYVPFL